MIFDWDDANVTHIAEHDVAPEEAEEVILGDPLDVEFDIDRKLTAMAVLAQVIRAHALGISDGGQHRFRTQLHIAGDMAAGAG